MLDIAYAIGLKPEAAIAYFESKGYTIGFNWHDIEAQAHATAFTVAGVLKQDVLHDIRQAFTEQLINGGTSAQFKKTLVPTLESKGWLGRGLVADDDGVLEGKRLTPRRLDTIFQTNMQSALNVGRYQAQLANAETRPYWQYIAILDDKTRPAHAALDGRVFRYDDPIWQTIYPPNGFNCRCRIRALSVRDVERLGLTVESSEGLLADIEQPWGNGQTRTVTAYKDPLTGRLFVPDAGFGHNPGQSYLSDLGQHLLERSIAAEPYLASLAVRETLNNETLLNSVLTDVKTFVNTVLNEKVARGKVKHVGALLPDVINQLAIKGLAPESATITLTDANLLHILRDSKDNKLPVSLLEQLPLYLRQPDAVIYDKSHTESALMYVFSLPQTAKLIVYIDSEIKVRNPITAKREHIKSNVIRTGKVLANSDALKNNKDYELLWGEID